EPFARDLVKPDRLAEVAEAVKAEIDGVGLGCEADARSRRENLPARADPEDAGGAVERRPEVVAVSLVGRARVDRHAYAGPRAVAPRRRRERALQGDRGRDRCTRVGERGADAVAGVLEEPAATVRDRRARDRVVARERIWHGGGMLAPEPGAALDGGEEEGHRVGGCRSHAPSLSRRWAMSRPRRRRGRLAVVGRADWVATHKAAGWTRPSAISASSVGPIRGPHVGPPHVPHGP